MKTCLVSLSLFALLAAQTGMAADYKVDTAHSHIGFSVKHMMSYVPGSFKDFSGEFSFDPKKPADDKANFTIQVASISTDNEKRDGHLKSEDFFDAGKYPTITFVSKKVAPAGKDKYKVTGDFSMHGVTRPETFEVEYLGAMKGMDGTGHVGFTATTKLNRKDFKIVWNKALDGGGFVLGDDVTIKLDIDGGAAGGDKEAAKETPKEKK